MGLFNQSKVKDFIVKFFNHTVYFFTALTACGLALVVVLSFLNPAVSEEEKSIKSSVKDIYEGVKGALIGKNSNLEQESKNENDLEALDEIKIPEEVASPPGEVAAPPIDSPPDQLATPVPADKKQENPNQQIEEASPPGEVATPPIDSSPDQLATPVPADKKQENPNQQIEEASPLPESTPLNEDPSSSSEADIEVQSYMAPFIYEAIQQRSPFEDPTEQSSQSQEGIVIIPKTPPEEYDLTEIKLKGIIWDSKKPKALFALPNNAGYYSLIKGDKIGKNGVIFEIRESEVVIVETNYIGPQRDQKAEQLIKIKKIDRIGLTD